MKLFEKKGKKMKLFEKNRNYLKKMKVIEKNEIK
jgi:hypothetical protein